MHTPQRTLELGEQLRKRQGECRPAADHHVIMPAPRRHCRSPHHFPEPAPHPVALDRIADLFGDGEAEPRGPGVLARVRLEHERRCRGLDPPGCGEKIRPLLQPLDQSRAGSAFRHSAACGRARAARRLPCGRPWLPCGCESHADACAPACWVDRSASRMDLRIARHARHGGSAPNRAPVLEIDRPAAGRAKSRGLYGTAIGQVNARLRCNRENARRLRGRGKGCLELVKCR